MHLIDTFSNFEHFVVALERLRSCSEQSLATPLLCYLWVLNLMLLNIFRDRILMYRKTPFKTKTTMIFISLKCAFNVRFLAVFTTIEQTFYSQSTFE